MSRPLIADAKTEALVGLVVFGFGAFLLWDAYEGHGAPVPLILRPFLPV